MVTACFRSWGLARNKRLAAIESKFNGSSKPQDVDNAYGSRPALKHASGKSKRRSESANKIKSSGYEASARADPDSYYGSNSSGYDQNSIRL
mmetsp:Transcript_104279/g.185357  ORF Transcript_104279/g.185357 Transcript_104279/m.185357 type:complete len:92 (-) Transcript_104279:119-394(-)